MLVGSAPSELKLGTTTVTGVRRGAGLIYDSDVAAFQKASGATQVGPILALVDYLKAQSLWDYARFYPMKSAQNAGSGSTVYGLGGLTSNNMTLVNSPTWGSGGLTFASASSQYGRISDFLGGGTLAAFWRGTNTKDDSPVLCQYDFGAADRAWGIIRRITGQLDIRRSETGIQTEAYVDGSFPESESTIAAYWVDGSPPITTVNGETVATSPDGAVVGIRKNSSGAITLGVFLSNGVPAAAYHMTGTSVFAGFIETALTTTQRETITDLINAL